jgi:hypothetical protein
MRADKPSTSDRPTKVRQRADGGGVRVRRSRSAHCGGRNSLLSQPVVLSVFMGSGRSHSNRRLELPQSKQRSVRCPLPPGGSDSFKSVPQWRQVGRLAWPIAKILSSVPTSVNETSYCINLEVFFF